MNIKALFVKAEQFIYSAQLLANVGDYDSAASRLYYAMFFVSEALLSRFGLEFSSHRALIAAYGLHFAKTHELDPRFHRMLISAFEKRQLGDYTPESGLIDEDIAGLSADANEFLAAARQWLADHPQAPQP
jgi:uncharacterized protein (UPF0332 family)